MKIKLVQKMIDKIRGKKKKQSSKSNDAIVYRPSTLPSPFVHKYLKDLKGVEIGAAQHNPFYLNAINVDFTDEDTVWNQNQKFKDSPKGFVDIVASGDDLPFKDGVCEYIFNSHVIEHFWDPIKALKEWERVVKLGGYILLVVPHKERTFDKDRERTTLQELIDRHNGTIKEPEYDKLANLHHSVWITEDFLELCRYLNLNVIDYLDVDDKVGNSFMITIKK